MGSQWPGMASDLMEIPCFYDSIRRCDKYIRPIGYDIFDILTNPDPKILEEKPIVAFLAIATMHVSEINYYCSEGLFSGCKMCVYFPYRWFFFKKMCD